MASFIVTPFGVRHTRGVKILRFPNSTIADSFIYVVIALALCLIPLLS
jgi:hypothetical protein